MIQVSSGLTASVQILTLGKGLYLISVKAASPQKLGDDAELSLPAIHVGAGPGAPVDQIEIMPGPRNDSSWLFESKDMLIAKVKSGPANLLLTSIRAPSMPQLEVEVQRLGVKAPAAASPSPEPPSAAPVLAITHEPPAPTPVRAITSEPVPPAPPAPLRDAAGRVPLRLRVALHIESKGDVAYVDNYWAGALGERLAIEAFSITPLEGIETDQLEYKSVAEDGRESKWAKGGFGCGSRSRHVALTGFAVRLKGAAAIKYACEYRGSFSSGKIVGPLRDGELCQSDPGDRLEAIQLFIVERASQAPPAETGSIAAGSAAEPSAEARRIGPRFSVFRESLDQ